MSTASSIVQAWMIALADGHVAADAGGEAAQFRVRAVVADVDDAAVLQVGAIADADEVDVAADHGERPDRHVVAEHHVADDAGRRIDVGARAKGGQAVAEGRRTDDLVSMRAF